MPCDTNTRQSTTNKTPPTHQPPSSSSSSSSPSTTHLCLHTASYRPHTSPKISTSIVTPAAVRLSSSRAHPEISPPARHGAKELFPRIHASGFVPSPPPALGRQRRQCHQMAPQERAASEARTPPAANPTTLSPANRFLQFVEAGFWFNPSPDHEDNVTCFLCNKSMEGWEHGDDPVAEHRRHCPDCGWALTVAIQETPYDEHNCDPHSYEFSQARLMTFGNGQWPHNNSKNLCAENVLIPQSTMRPVGMRTYNILLDGECRLPLRP